MFNDAQIPEQTDTECHVCMAPHDEEIHAATLSVHEWFRFEVTKYFCDDSEELFLIDANAEEFELVA